MSKWAATIVVGLILGCGISLADGFSLTRGVARVLAARGAKPARPAVAELKVTIKEWDVPTKGAHPHDPARSEEHTSELQSPVHLVCRLLLEKKKKKIQAQNTCV